MNHKAAAHIMLAIAAYGCTTYLKAITKKKKLLAKLVNSYFIR